MIGRKQHRLIFLNDEMSKGPPEGSAGLGDVPKGPAGLGDGKEVC